MGSRTSWPVALKWGQNIVKCNTGQIAVHFIVGTEILWDWKSLPCLHFLQGKRNLRHFSHFSCMGGRVGRGSDASHVDLESCHPSLLQNPFPPPPRLVFISSSCLSSCVLSLPHCFFFLPLPTESLLLFPSSLPPLPSFALFLVSSHFLPHFPCSAQTRRSPADTERSPNVGPLNAHTHTCTHTRTRRPPKATGHPTQAHLRPSLCYTDSYLLC